MLDTIIEQFAQRDAHWAIQFIKYSLAGGAATVTDIIVFYILSWRVFPALKENDIAVRILHIKTKAISEQERARNFIVNTAIAFIFSNMVAYLINMLWVFGPGGHAWYIEVALFYLVSLSSIVLGTALGWAMIKFMKLSTTSSYIGKMIAALLINFICRKFIVFRG